ncbi:flagellar biosynthesis anti-sigma factor FlgM [Caballeronia sp. LZ032]|uniref:flagellar biosynthesis anti-sigma factor FlgM n=1 Tax=Caballeronia sp. LZ032 TaxID=3038565 RepID=UPI00285E4ED8|nr:flagellar biosynthesis anti-sigma factor FlgM [Caballeronia sp. LZ032]MDR5880455.1 flagellar biosynthesis anti-sigma factor FlgM [Caballeronia sp. LZ032]
MKIQSTNNPAMPEPITVRRATNEADFAAAPQHSDAVAADSSAVTLSSTSAFRTSSATDIDADKVAAIKAALSNGTYRIDSGSIADGMLGLARDLLRKAPRE